VIPMHIAYAFAYLIISGGFAFSSTMYAPPGFAQVQMMRALASVEAVEMQGSVKGETPFEGLHTISADARFGIDVKEGSGMIHAQGQIKNGSTEIPFQGDFLARDGKGYVRLAYAPLKLITNQWIEIPGSMALGAANFAPLFQMRFTKRLATVRQDGRRFAQYAFQAVSESGIGDGAVLLDRRTHLPAVVSGTFTTPQGTGEVALRMVSYNNPIASATPSYVREASEVLAQLSDSAKKIEFPIMLPMLSLPVARLDDFTRDSDHDGLPDAVEQVYGTDPASPDTDNDAYLDGDEVMKGYNPRGEGEL